MSLSQKLFFNYFYGGRRGWGAISWLNLSLQRRMYLLYQFLISRRLQIIWANKQNMIEKTNNQQSCTLCSDKSDLQWWSSSSEPESQSSCQPDELSCSSRSGARFQLGLLQDNQQDLAKESKHIMFKDFVWLRYWGVSACIENRHRRLAFIGVKAKKLYYLLRQWQWQNTF